jgi:alkaline phosphatase D
MGESTAMRGRGVTWALLAVVAGVAGGAAAASTQEESPVVRRIAFGSCVDQAKRQPVWDAIVRFRPDLFIFAGDTHYPRDARNMEMRAEDIAKLGENAGFQKLRKTTPILATWGDDDFGIDDPAAEPGKREAVRKIFLDFFEVPADSPRRTRRGIWDAVVLGPPGRRIQVILLDTRFNRTPLKKKSLLERSEGPYAPNPDPAATYLGPEQWAFLAEELRKPAELRLIVSDIQVVVEDGNYEKWGNFPVERERLFSLLRETGASGVVFLSGDRHLAEISEMDAGLGYPLMDVTASGLNQAAYNFLTNRKNRYRVETPLRANNFGTIVVEWERQEPRVTIELREEDGAAPLLLRLPLASLRKEEGRKIDHQKK